tara:strand:+ start:724 stop:921 length:198 start_codon:yes stop_codon:yes gene_type:complete
MAKKKKEIEGEEEEGCPECGAMYGSAGCGPNEDGSWRCGPKPKPEPEPEPEPVPPKAPPVAYKGV